MIELSHLHLLFPSSIPSVAKITSVEMKQSKKSGSTAPSTQTLSLIAKFFEDHDLNATGKTFAKELKKLQRSAGPPTPDLVSKGVKLEDIIETYNDSGYGTPGSQDNLKKAKPTLARAGKTKSASSDTSGSSSSDSAGSSSSEDDSSSDESEAEVARPAEKHSQRVKRSTRASSSSSSGSSGSSSSSSSSTDSDADDEDEALPEAKPSAGSTKTSRATSLSSNVVKKSLKRKAESSSSDSSTSDSESSVSDRAAKRTKRDPSSSSSDDSSSSEDSSSASESASIASAASESSSEESSDSDRSSADEDEDHVIKPAATGLSGAASLDSSEERSESSGTVQGDNVGVEITSVEHKVQLIDGQTVQTKTATTTTRKHTGAKPTPLAELSALATEDSHISNAYQSYNYADRAYNDLSVTRGKGFTKEKNKKKRGSYRGGLIDISGGKGFKFDD